MIRYRLIKLVIIITSVFALVEPHSALSLTYDDVVRESINSSAGLWVKMEDVRIAHAQYRGSFAGLYPEISANGRTEKYENLDHRNQQTIDTIGNEVVGGNQTAWRASLSLSGQYYISHWYKKRYEAQYYEKMRDVSVHDCESTAKKNIKDVTEIFGGIAEGKLKLQYGAEFSAGLKILLKLRDRRKCWGNFHTGCSQSPVRCSQHGKGNCQDQERTERVSGASRCLYEK